MSAKTPVTVQVTHRFSASPERVFDAWLDPQKAGKFLFATPHGQMVRVEIDARVGGKFVIVDRRDGEDVEHLGEYLEIDRPRRLVFTISVKKYSSDTSRIVVEITPLDAGCELTLTHALHPDWEDRKENIAAGWAGILEGLAATIE